MFENTLRKTILSTAPMAVLGVHSMASAQHVRATMDIDVKAQPKK